MLLRYQQQTDKHSLTLFLGPGFTSTSPLSIIERLHSDWSNIEQQEIWCYFLKHNPLKTEM